IWASPNTQSLAISVFFHAALLAAPLLVSGLGYNSSPHVPRGDGAMAIDWVELSEAPSPPPVHPAKVVAHQARAAAESVVVPQKKEVGMAAETDAPTSELGSPSARVLTLG